MIPQKRIIEYSEPVQPLKKVLELEEKIFVLDVEQEIKMAFDKDVELGMALLFVYYYAVLCSHAARLVQSKVVAEDIVSDILYEFHIHERHHAIKSSFRAFLFTAVRNRAFDYIKMEMRHKELLEDSHFVETLQTPENITQYEELYTDFQKAIHALPLKRQQIYLMSRFDGKKNQDIADEHVLSIRTVEAHIYEANRQIRKFLSNKWLIIITLGYFLGF